MRKNREIELEIKKKKEDIEYFKNEKKFLRRVFKYILIDIVIFFIARYYCATLPVESQMKFCLMLFALGSLIILLCILYLGVQSYRQININKEILSEKQF